MKSMCQEARRNSPSVAVRRPTSRCRATTSRIAASSASRRASASIAPEANASRASSSSGGRSRLPTWSARNGGGAAGHPPVLVLYVLAALMASAGALQNVARQSIVPNLVAPARLRGALALNFGLLQLTLVIGPGAGGLVIGAAGVAGAYGVDAVSCAAMAVAAWR